MQRRDEIICQYHVKMASAAARAQHEWVDDRYTFARSVAVVRWYGEIEGHEPESAYAVAKWRVAHPEIPRIEPTEADLADADRIDAALDRTIHAALRAARN